MIKYKKGAITMESYYYEQYEQLNSNMGGYTVGVAGQSVKLMA